MTPHSCVCRLGKPPGALPLDAFKLRNFGISTGEAGTSGLSSVIVSDGEVTAPPTALYADIRNSTLWVTTTNQSSPPYYIELPAKSSGGFLIHIMEWVARNAVEQTSIMVYTLPGQPDAEDLATESVVSDAP